MTETCENEEGCGYKTIIEADNINKFHVMENLADVVLKLAEGEDKDVLMSKFLLTIMEKDIF